MNVNLFLLLMISSLFSQISALLDVLSHQLEAFGDVRDDIVRKEPEMHALTLQAKELVSKSPADISSTIQERLESLQSDWQEVEKRAKERTGVLQNALDQSRRYKVAVDVFVPFLQRSENSVAAFTPISFRLDENAVQLVGARELQVNMILKFSYRTASLFDWMSFSAQFSRNMYHCTRTSCTTVHVLHVPLYTYLVKRSFKDIPNKSSKMSSLVELRMLSIKALKVNGCAIMLRMENISK